MEKFKLESYEIIKMYWKNFSFFPTQIIQFVYSINF